MRKKKSRPNRDYVVDWLNAFRLLWHVFTSPGSRRKTGEPPIDAAPLDSSRASFHDVGKIAAVYWLLPLALDSLLV